MIPTLVCIFVGFMLLVLSLFAEDYKLTREKAHLVFFFGLMIELVGVFLMVYYGY